MDDEATRKHTLSHTLLTVKFRWSRDPSDGSGNWPWTGRTNYGISRKVPQSSCRVPVEGHGVAWRHAHGERKPSSQTCYRSRSICAFIRALQTNLNIGVQTTTPTGGESLCVNLASQPLTDNTVKWNIQLRTFHTQWSTLTMLVTTPALAQPWISIPTLRHLPYPLQTLHSLLLKAPLRRKRSPRPVMLRGVPKTRSVEIMRQITFLWDVASH